MQQQYNCLPLDMSSSIFIIQYCYAHVLCHALVRHLSSFSSLYNICMTGNLASRLELIEFSVNTLVGHLITVPLPFRLISESGCFQCPIISTDAQWNSHHGCRVCTLVLMNGPGASKSVIWVNDSTTCGIDACRMVRKACQQVSKSLNTSRCISTLHNAH